MVERGDLNRAALQIIQENPFLGIGAGHFPLELWLQALPIKAENVHNVALLLAAETGIVGGAIWLFLILLAIWLLWRHRRQPNQWLYAALCAWLALAIISFFDFYPWSLNSGRLLTATLLGLIAAQLTGTQRL